MLEQTSLYFGPFHLDLSNERVRRGQDALKLTRKALAVLRYLVEHAGQLVTKEAFFAAAWTEVVVGDAVLAVCIRELRQVLGDDPKAPQYIETVYGRGYRFIGKVVSNREQSGIRDPVSEVENSHSTLLTRQSALNLVGREAELTHLHHLLEKALTGQRQLVFVTGEPGIGKTTLVRAFRQ